MHACQGCESQRFNTKRFVSGLITRQAEADGPPLPPPSLWAAVFDNQLRLAKIRPGPSVNHFQRKHGRRSRIELGADLSPDDVPESFGVYTPCKETDPLSL